MPRVWRGVIFDLDGTLVDSLPGIAAALNAALEECAMPGHPLAAVRGFIGRGARELARRALPPGLPAVEEVAARVEEAFRGHYAATWRSGTRPYPDVPEALVNLTEKGLRLAVLSNKPHAFTVEMVAALLPGIPFATVLGQRDGVPRKPDPASALEACAALGCAVGEVLLVGDSTVDIETARCAGLPVAVVTWGYHDREALAAAGADHWIERPADLRELAWPRS